MFYLLTGENARHHDTVNEKRPWQNCSAKVLKLFLSTIVSNPESADQLL